MPDLPTDAPHLILLKIVHHHPVLPQLHLPPPGLLLAAQNEPQQSGLPAPVRADEGELLPALDLEVGSIEQRLGEGGGGGLGFRCGFRVIGGISGEVFSRFYLGRF